MLGFEEPEILLVVRDFLLISCSGTDSHPTQRGTKRRPSKKSLLGWTERIRVQLDAERSDGPVENPCLIGLVFMDQTGPGSQ